MAELLHTGVVVFGLPDGFNSCQWCGRTFRRPRRQGPAKYCGDECRRAALNDLQNVRYHAKRGPPPQPRQCPHCRQTFTPPRRGDQWTYCSAYCRQAASRARRKARQDGLESPAMTLSALTVKARGRATRVTVNGVAVETKGIKTAEADNSDVGALKGAARMRHYMQLPTADVGEISAGDVVSYSERDGTTGNYAVDAVLSVDVLPGVTRVRLRTA